MINRKRERILLAVFFAVWALLLLQTVVFKQYESGYEMSILNRGKQSPLLTFLRFVVFNECSFFALAVTLAFLAASFLSRKFPMVEGMNLSFALIGFAYVRRILVEYWWHPENGLHWFQYTGDVLYFLIPLVCLDVAVLLSRGIPVIREKGKLAIPYWVAIGINGILLALLLAGCFAALPEENFWSSRELVMWAVGGIWLLDTVLFIALNLVQEKQKPDSVPSSDDGR